MKEDHVALLYVLGIQQLCLLQDRHSSRSSTALWNHLVSLGCIAQRERPQKEGRRFVCHLVLLFAVVPSALYNPKIMNQPAQISTTWHQQATAEREQCTRHVGDQRPVIAHCAWRHHAWVHFHKANLHQQHSPELCAGDSEANWLHKWNTVLWAWEVEAWWFVDWKPSALSWGSRNRAFVSAAKYYRASNLGGRGL